MQLLDTILLSATIRGGGGKKGNCPKWKTSAVAKVLNGGLYLGDYRTLHHKLRKIILIIYVALKYYLT